MSLSKQQMIGAVGAGIFVVCAGGLGWMLYSAWSDKGEVETKVTEEQLNEVLQKKKDWFITATEALELGILTELL